MPSSPLERGGAQRRGVSGRTPRAFSLIEIVVAIGIFAIGFVAVLALLTPIAKSVAGVSESEAAARTADAVIARVSALAAKDFSTAAALVQDAAAVQKNDGDGAYNPNDGAKHPAVLFGKRPSADRNVA